MDLSEIAAINSLLGYMPASSKGKIYIACVLALICLLVVSALWEFHLPTARVHLAIRSDAVTLRTASEFRWSGRWNLGKSRVHIQEISKVELPPEFSASGDLVDRAWLDIDDGKADLIGLTSKPNSLLSIARGQSDAVDLRSKDAALDGQLTVSGSPRVTAGRAQDTGISVQSAMPLEIPAIVGFHDLGRSGAPAVLSFSPIERVIFRDISIVGLNFLIEVDTRIASFRSAIRSGTAVVSDTGETIPLTEGSHLHLDNATGLISELAIDAGGMTVLFEGEVRNALLGPPGFERELKPSLLEYIYHQQKFGFVWGAATFIWGLLWSGRQLLF
jgi:hypothetical protein